MNRLTVKVGMVGDAQIGKTSLMVRQARGLALGCMGWALTRAGACVQVRWVENKFDEDYIQTLGALFAAHGAVRIVLMGCTQA